MPIHNQQNPDWLQGIQQELASMDLPNQGMPAPQNNPELEDAVRQIIQRLGEMEQERQQPPMVNVQPSPTPVYVSPAVVNVSPKVTVPGNAKLVSIEFTVTERDRNGDLLSFEATPVYASDSD